MARVITVSRFFPQYHPRKGEPTLFIEKIYASMADNIEGFQIPNDANDYWDFHEYYNCTSPKHHTIRKGKRWKTGDKASIRIWGDDVNPKSGRKGAYHSKQISIAPDVEVIVFDFEIKNDEADNLSIYIDHKFYCQIGDKYSKLVAKNDGLNLEDLKAWFKFPCEFSGQIISFNKNLNY